MDFDKILNGLSKISPAIGTMLGGPVGGVIGTGVAVAAKAITGKSDPDEIIRELTTSPEKLAELEAQAQAMEIEKLRIHAADRDSARDMQTELAKAKHGSAWSSTIVSVVVTVGFFWVLNLVITGETAALPQVALVMLGALAGGFTQVLNYWLGSSKGSSEKTALLVGIGK